MDAATVRIVWKRECDFVESGSTFAVRPRRPSICSPPFCLAQSSNCGIPGLYDRTNASDRRECNGCGAALDEEGKKEGRRARATTTLP